MLSLEQIRRLESRVYKAVELLKAMKEDNNILKSELKSANERVEELEQIISDYRNNQLEIEQGIVKAIQQLDDLDSIDDSLSENTEEPVPSKVISTETFQDNTAPENAKESAVSASADVTADSNASANPETVEETESAEESQQLDIF